MQGDLSRDVHPIPAPLSTTLARAVMAGLLDKRLIFVTGKGGTGKSTVSIALGLAAARQGKRTMVAEVSRQERVAHAFHHDAAGFAETEIAPNLFTISIAPSESLKEY